MAEYIEREKALNDFDEWIETTGTLPKGTSYYHECRACIEDVTAADVVEVIRCKNCKFLMFSDCYGECSKAYMGVVSPDDFCSRGERRSDNAEM